MTWLTNLIARYDHAGFIRGVRWLAGLDNDDDFDELTETFPDAKRAD